MSVNYLPTSVASLVHYIFVKLFYIILDIMESVFQDFVELPSVFDAPRGLQLWKEVSHECDEVSFSSTPLLFCWFKLH